MSKRPLFQKVCAIYSRAKVMPPGDVVSLADDAVPQFDKNDDDWRTCTVAGRHATLVMSRSVFTGPGFSGANGTFNSSVLGAVNYFKNIETPLVDVQKALKRRISETESLIGCVGQPALSVDDGHYDLIFGIARAFDGIIFDSDAMLSADGVVILDVHGRAGDRVDLTGRRRPSRKGKTRRG